MGSSNNSATRAAEQSEAQRRAQVAATQRQIEGIYSTPEREAQVQDLIGATRGQLTGDLNRQNEEAQRQLKFALARSGQAGGSVAVDQGKKQGDAYLRGVLEAERRAQAAGSSLRGADQAAKQNLFSLAQSGLDMTTAARQAGEAMRVNLGNARADATQSGIGDLFSGFGDLYERSKKRAGEAAAQKNQYFTAYAPSQFAAGGGYGGGP
jgi:hypothetical protein